MRLSFDALKVFASSVSEAASAVSSASETSCVSGALRFLELVAVEDPGQVEEALLESESSSIISSRLRQKTKS